MTDTLRPDLTPAVRQALLDLLGEDALRVRAPIEPLALLTIVEAARLLELDRTEVYRLVKAGLLPAYMIRETMTFTLEDTRAYDRNTPIPTKKRKRSMRREGLSVRTRFRILERDGFRCTYCGADANSARLTVDHVVSVADGGRDDDTNLVTACEPCNLGKGRRSLRAVG